MIQRIQSIYFLFAAILIAVVGTTTDLLHVEVKNGANQQHLASLNLSGFSMKGDLTISATQLSKEDLIGKIATQKNTTFNIDGDVIHAQHKRMLGLAFLFLAAWFLVVIFMFKNQKRQLLLAKIGFFFTILLCLAFCLLFLLLPDTIQGHVRQVIGITVTASAEIGLGVYFLACTLPLLFFGINAIKKDIRLVKSIDRIR